MFVIFTRIRELTLMVLFFAIFFSRKKLHFAGINFRGLLV